MLLKKKLTETAPDNLEAVISQAITLSEKMLEEAHHQTRHLEKDKDWTVFFKLYEQREVYVDQLGQVLIADPSNPLIEATNIELRTHISRLLGLNQTLLNVCQVQKQAFQQALLRSKKAAKVKSAYQAVGR